MPEDHTNKKVVKQVAKGKNIVQVGGDFVIKTSEDIQAIFDEAADLINRGEARTAQVLLEGLWKRHNDKMTPPQRSKCKRLIGCSFDRQDRLEEAGRSFLEAKDHDPTSEKARAFEALGYVCLGNPAKARELAEGVLADFSQNGLAWSVWVRTAPKGLSFAQVEAKIPEHLRQDPEVAMSLAVRAATEGNFDVAERYIAQVQSSVPGNPRVIEKLGDLMLTRARVGEHLLHQRGPTIEEKGYLNKAEAFFTDALRKWEEEQSRSSIVRVLLRRACAHKSLAKHDEALQDIRTAYETDKESSEAVYWYAMTVSQQSLDQAIDLLKTIVGKGPIPDAEHLLGQMLRERGREGDLQQALEILKSRVNDLAKGAPDFRVEYIALLLQIEREVEGIKQAQVTLDSISEDLIGSTARTILSAELLWLNGDSVNAVKCAKSAIAALSDKVRLEDKRRLANLLQRMGLHREALLIWKDIVRPEYIGRDTYSLLECAQRCEDAKFVIEFSEKLRASGLWDRRIFELELNYRELYNDNDGAKQVMQEFLRETPDVPYAPFVRLRLSVLGIRIGQFDLVETDPERLPAVSEVEPRIGRLMVTVLRYGKEPVRAVEYAYDLLRLNRDISDAHLAMMDALLPIGPKVVVQEPGEAGPGTAVQYREDDTGVSHWHIVEDSKLGAPDPDHNEFAPGHPLSKAIEGKRCNESFYLRKDSLQDRTATIKRIVSKYVYRFNDCLEHFETIFPHEKAIQKFIAIDKTDKLDTGPLDRLAKQDAEYVERLEDIYENIVCPLFLLAQKKGRSLLEAMNYVAAKPGLRLKCCRGTDEEEKVANQAIQKATAIIADSSAIITLLFTRTYEKIREFTIPIIVSQGTINELRGAEALQGDPDSWAGSYSSDGFVRVSPEQVVEAREKLEKLIEFVEGNCTIESGLVVAELESGRREQLIQLFGRAGLEAMTLAAQEGRVLWTDDLATAELARTELGCKRVWTQFVFNHFADEGVVEREFAMALTVQLLQMEYYYTMPSIAAIMRAMEDANWDVDKAPLFQALNWFGDPNVKLQGVYYIGSGVVKRVWQESVVESKAQEVTIRILERISQRRGGFRVIDALLTNIDRIFGLDVINANKAKATIKGWLAGTRGTRIILP